MNVLITGGSGIIGTTMAEKLLAAGDSVTLLDRAPATERLAPLVERHGDRLQVAVGDVLSFGNLGDAVRQGRADVIVHLAYSLGAESNANPQAATEVNMTGTVNVLEIARLLEVPRVVMASSIAVYGNDDAYAPDQLPLTEHMPLHIAPQLPIYGGGKVYLEKLGQHYRNAYGLLVVGMRPSIVYGWGRRTGATGWMSSIVEEPVRGRATSVGFGEARVSVVYVEDVAEQFIALVRAAPDVFTDTWFFNTGGDTCRVRDVVETVRELVPGAQIELTSGGERDLYGLAASVSDESMERIVGYKRQFTPLPEALRAYIETVRTREGIGT
jgi:nucleoside-diphosphate-sugar epimerase